MSQSGSDDFAPSVNNPHGSGLNTWSIPRPQPRVWQTNATVTGPPANGQPPQQFELTGRDQQQLANGNGHVPYVGYDEDDATAELDDVINQYDDDMGKGRAQHAPR